MPTTSPIAKPATRFVIRPTRMIFNVVDGSENDVEVSHEESPDNPDHWSVYEQLADGEERCLCDCADEHTALRICDAVSTSKTGVDLAAGFDLEHSALSPCSTGADHPEDDQDGRLVGVTSINGCRMHIEAIPVVMDDEGTQAGSDSISNSRHEGLCDEFGVRGFQTVDIVGTPYVLVLTPFGL